jgi:hypothetical protein
MLIVRVQGLREPGSLLVLVLYMLMVSWMRGGFLIPLCFVALLAAHVNLKLHALMFVLYLSVTNSTCQLRKLPS